MLLIEEILIRLKIIVAPEIAPIINWVENFDAFEDSDNVELSLEYLLEEVLWGEETWGGGGLFHNPLLKINPEFQLSHIEELLALHLCQLITDQFRTVILICFWITLDTPLINESI